MLPPREPDRRPVAEIRPRPPHGKPIGERANDGRLMLKPRLRIVDRERAEHVMRALTPSNEPC